MTFHALADDVSISALMDEASFASFINAMQSTVIARVYLVELYAYQPTNSDAGDWIDPIATLAIGELPEGLEGQSGIVQLNYSDRGFTTTPSDAVANEHYASRAKVPLVIERAMPLTPEEQRRIPVQYGYIELMNHDGALDSIIQSYAIDGRRVRVLAGKVGDAYADFGVIFDGTATAWEPDNDVVRLGIRDNSYLLNVPLQQSLYGGSGGSDGTTDNQGKPKPMAFGICRNITPILIDPSKWIFQFHSRAAQSVDAVYSQGAAITSSGADYATYAALAAASITAGQYATCLAEGMFRINFGGDAGLVTADIKGDASSSYVNTAGSIALRILRDFGGLTDAYIDSGAFTSLDAAQPAIIGWYSRGDALTVDETVSQILSGICASWYARRDGRLACCRVEAPTTTDIAIEIDENHILDIRRVQPPAEIDPPNYRRRVAWQKNWTVQRGEDLAATVTATRRNFLTQEYRISTAYDGTVLTRHLQATDPAVLPTLFDVASDADAEATRELNIYKVGYSLYDVTLKSIGHLADLNSSVRFSYPRFLLSRRAGRVVRVREDCDNKQVVLRLWG